MEGGRFIRARRESSQWQLATCRWRTDQDSLSYYRCYYNSILQSLTCTLPLTSLIHNPPSSSPTLSILAPASDSPLASLPHPSPLPVSSALLLLLERLELNPYASGNEKAKKTVNPRELLNVLAKRNEEYRDGLYQEDAHELLRCLIDCVLMEEVDVRSAPLACCLCFCSARVYKHFQER